MVHQSYLFRRYAVPLSSLANDVELNFDEIDSTPSCLDPIGPWNLESTIQLPDCAEKLTFTTAHDRANITVSHILKIMLRVERGDDDFLDSKGKRKLWDVIIEVSLDSRGNKRNWSSDDLLRHRFTSSPVAAPKLLYPPIPPQTARQPSRPPSSPNDPAHSITQPQSAARTHLKTASSRSRQK